MDAAALPACLKILRRVKPDVVLGGGGYVSGPMVAAARILRIPVALTEADAHLGLANRWAAPFAKRVFLSFPIDGRDGDKYRVVGRPIPARSVATDPAEARARFGLPAEGPGRADLRREHGRARAERGGRRGVRRRGPGGAPFLRRDAPRRACARV